jgi:hypothetical protein
VGNDQLGRAYFFDVRAWPFWLRFIVLLFALVSLGLTVVRPPERAPTLDPEGGRGFTFNLLSAHRGAGGMQIISINFDPDGADDGSNRHLNKEWILLVNRGNRAVQLRGWKVIDAGRDHVYRFGSIYLEPDAGVRLRTGRGGGGAPICEVGQECGPPRFDEHWDLDNYVWNNDGDTAKLKNASGDLVDRCRYTSSTDSPVRC